jgi:hypothetical protein
MFDVVRHMARSTKDVEAVRYPLDQALSIAETKS